MLSGEAGEVDTADQHDYYNSNWVDLRETEPHGNTEVRSGGWLSYSAGLAFMPYDKIGGVMLDYLLPLYILLIWPVVQLTAPGNINNNPWWNCNRLAFSVPDMTGALFLLALALPGVGVTKLWILIEAVLATSFNQLQPLE